VLIGYLGIRTFTPHPVSKLLESIGARALGRPITV